MSPIKAASHLPLLYNPFLNCIFNNPYYQRSPFKNTIQELSNNHIECTLLVPKSEILQDAFEPTSYESNNKVLLKELCYNNEDFIRSHIIKTSSPISTTSAPISKVQSTIYSTLNGKQILIKNGMVFTGKGFKRSLKIKIQKIDYFNSFCEYFPKGCKFMVIYIEDTLFGSVNPKSIYNSISTSEGIEGKISRTTKHDNDTITFELLLRTFPLLSKAVSEKFHILLHQDDSQNRILHYKVRSKLSVIQSEFHRIVDAAYSIISDTVNNNTADGNQAYHSLDYILKSHPGLDLNKLVHEYVEINLYDKIWSRIIYQFNFPNEDKADFDKEAFKVLTSEKYEKLSCLSLNQLDMSIDKPWHMNELYRRISRSIGELLKLNDINIMDSFSKMNIFLNTVNTLTRNTPQHTNSVNRAESMTSKEDLLIDADMLLSLLIIVITHAKVENLEAHLYYVKHFNRIDYANDGYLNYIFSNFDAVILHLSTTGDSELVQASKSNERFWSYIQGGEIKNIREMLQNIESEYDNKELPNTHFLRSRNLEGESCLMLAVKSRNYEIFDLLINFNIEWFTIDDILFDKNTTTNQNLLMGSLIEDNHNVTLGLIEIIKSSCTIEEQESYINTVDKSGRSVGHYLFHDYEVIDSIGHLIDWELKDNNSHTPLFTLCRCYDHSNYSELVYRGFECVYKKYAQSKLNFHSHVDKLGNTLLHVILKGLPGTKLLTKKENLVNVNQFNNKNVTPLEFYVKYNRFENLRSILKDDRLLFKLEDPQNFYNVFDFLGFMSIKSVGNNKVHEDIDQLLCSHFIDNYFPKSEVPMVALNAKYDPNMHDWIITLRNDKGEVMNRSLERIKQALYLTKLQNELSIFPNEEMFWHNFPINIKVSPLFSKLRINKIIDNLNMLFIHLELQQTGQQTALFLHILKQDDKDSSVLDSIKHIKVNQEYQRNKLGKVQLVISQIEEMEYFLGFSMDDLDIFKRLLSKINKLIAICSVKDSDVWIVLEKEVSYIAESGVLSNKSNSISNSIETTITKESVYKELHSFTMWLEKSLEELLLNIAKVLDKIKSWKELHHSISEVGQNLKSFEMKYAANLPISNGTPAENTEHSSSYFGFGNIVENKKSKYKKMLIVKSEKIDQILKLNATIKNDHEMIASEISNFIKFKADFFKFAIKQYTFLNIRCLKQRQYELSNYLGHING